MQMTSKTAVRVAAALLSGAIASTSYAQFADPYFTYQGVIVDENGGPVGPAAVVRFSLYRTPSGSPLLNGLQYTVPVSTDGAFTQRVDLPNEVIGGGPLHTGEPLYLEIMINGEVLSPRQEVTPTPLAMSMPGVYSYNGQVRLGESMNDVVVGNGTQNTNFSLNNGSLFATSSSASVANYTSTSHIGTWLTLDNTSPGGTPWAIIATGSANGEGPGAFVISDQSISTPRMVIDDLGNVGFGVSNPTERLDVAGAIRIRGADIVEGFDSSGGVIEPGTVVSIDPTPGHEGELMPSSEAYDTKVAGVVSGAGGIPYGMALSYDGQFGGDTKVAMTGRVYVKCSTESGPILAGDLLTSASVPGHAMKASDRDRAHGTVIGKAMSSLDDGTGLVLVLVNLQ